MGSLPGNDTLQDDESRKLVSSTASWSQGAPFWPPRFAKSDAVRDRPVLATIASLVERYGDITAVSDDYCSLSFRSMWRLVGNLADAILTTAPRPGPVAILLPADATYFPAILACLAAGRPSVFLDTAAPVLRNVELVRQTGASLILEPAGGAGLPADDTARLTVSTDAGLSRDVPATAPSSLGIDEPAFILCTSGSTGRPKAIVHSQRTMMHWGWWHANAIGIETGDLCLSLSSPTTLGGINGLLAFATAGAGTHYVDMRRRGLAGLLETLLTQPVTSLRAAPSLLRVLASLPDASQAMGRLRNVTTYGEPILRADIAALRAHLPSTASIFAGYGATESGGMGWYPSAEDDLDPVRTPAGRPVPGIEAIVLDDDGQPCGPGIDGELVVRSRYHALGEWQDGNCVPGALVPDRADPLRRIHRTGDLVRQSASGIFLVLGRKDRMLNINGRRIEPTEIEAAIRTSPEVTACAVTAQARGTSAVMTAYVVLRPDQRADALEHIRTVARERLPASMVPSRFIVLPALPMLAGGKVDYLALGRL